MKGSKFLIATALSLLFLLQSAGAADMLVQTWDPDMGCEHTMNTSYFEIAPGESVEIDLNMTGCTESELGRLLYVGYNAGKSRTTPLSAKHKIRLTLIDAQSGEELVSESGSIFTEVNQPGWCKLRAENMNRSKTLKIRLFSNSGL